MTQEEVDLIYDYLHKNYEYKNGELIRKIKSRTQPIGNKIGCFSYTEKRNPKILVTLNFNKNRFSLILPKVIWLYHFKEYPINLHYKDNNPTNLKIENLIKSTKEGIKKHRKVKNPFKLINNTYKAFIRFNYKTYHLGVYESEEDARLSYEIAKLNLINNPDLNPNEIRDIIKTEMGDKTTHTKNQSLIKGYFKKGSKYYVSISVNNKRTNIGSFETPQEAHQAYLKAKMELNKS